MDSVREQIQNQLARSKINSDQLYSIIKQIADHIDAPKDVSPAPARTVKPAPAPAPAPVSKKEEKAAKKAAEKRRKEEEKAAKKAKKKR